MRRLPHPRFPWDTAPTTGSIGILVSGFGSIGTALNIMTTILCMRCPGMKLGRMPMLVWLNSVMAFLVLMAIGPLTAAQIMLLIDRYLGGHFFDTQAGGSAVIWMHFFWIFGHPEVYILVLPAFGILSEVIPVFSRKPIFGYNIMVAATIAIGFISLSVWAHHMFTIGMTSYANAFFVASTAAIAVPTGIKIFNWIGTMWGGKIHFHHGDAVQRGGRRPDVDRWTDGHHAERCSVRLAAGQFLLCYRALSLRDSGRHRLCECFPAAYYWYPKVTGRMLNETLGKWHFWLFLIGFHLTFDFMHIPGISGHAAPHLYLRSQPRLGDLEPDRLDRRDLPGAGVLIWVVNVIQSYFKGKIAGNDPWDAWTLEWATTSPPPDYNFATFRWCAAAVRCGI